MACPSRPPGPRRLSPELEAKQARGVLEIGENRKRLARGSRRRWPASRPIVEDGRRRKGGYFGDTREERALDEVAAMLPTILSFSEIQ